MTKTRTKSGSSGRRRAVRPTGTGRGPFQGQYRASFQHDGRLKLNKPLAVLLRQHGCRRLYIAHSPVSSGIVLCPEREWTGYEKWLQACYSRKAWGQARELFLSAATLITVDAQGRITIPKGLLETLGMKRGGYLAVIGSGRWFFAYTAEVLRRLYESFCIGSDAKDRPGHAVPVSPDPARKFPVRAT